MANEVKPAKILTKREILERAIQRAIANGLNWGPNFVTDSGDELGVIHAGIVVRFNDEVMNVEAVIFNHDFAKALWGDGNPCSCGGTGHAAGMTFHSNECTISNNWKQNLQQMVIADDPIKYLRDHLDD